MKRKIRIFSGILLIFFFLASPACKNSQNSPRKYEKMEKKMMKEEEKAMEAARKEHMKIQSKATRKMMRDMKKRAKRLNNPKRK